MAKDINNCTFTGRLCMPPELKYIPSGVPVAMIRVAVNKAKEENGEKADFINFEVWRGAAEFVCQYLGVGSQVGIVGRLRIRTWKAQDGSKRTTSEIVVNEINALGKTVASDQGDETPPPPDVEADETDFNDPFADQ